MAKSENTKQTFDRLALAVMLLPAAVFLWLVALLPQIRSGEPFALDISWVPSLGVSFSLWIDGLSLIFGMVISLVGVFVVLYAGSYLAGSAGIRRFYSAILVFMLAMLGVVFSRNLITLFVFWELTSITSFILIGYYHEKEDSRKAAQQALVVTGSGGLVLLAGFLLIGLQAGSFDLQTILAGAASLQASPLYAAILVLVLIGAFTKSAQFPFHFWLPGAMAAPAPVSAYLHSATMVKAGIYLIARLMPILGGTTLWTGIIVPVGAVTMLLGAWISLRQTDLKRLLAYSTVSVLGMLTFLLGIGTSLAVKAALTILIAHALYKGALFLAAGAVDHETGTRDIRVLGGLRRMMPVTAGIVLLSGLSMAGLPPLFGFIGKELLYEVTLDGGSLAFLLTAVAFASSVFLVGVAALVAIRPFWSQPGGETTHVHEAPWPMLIGPALMAALSIGLGLFPAWIGKNLVAPGAAAVYGEAVTVKLALWHGFTPMLLLSGLTIAAGFGLFVYRRPVRALVEKSDFGVKAGPENLYRISWVGVERFAQIQTGILQNGSLPYYLLTVILTALIMIGSAIIRTADWPGVLRWSGEVRVFEVVFAALILVATLAVVRSRSRLAAVAALGVVGFSMAMMYVLLGAPDLAMTQFAIETLTVILFVLVLYRLPVFNEYTTRGTRIRDAVVAVFAGLMMTLLVIVVTATPLVSRLTPFFSENSYTLAKGRNIVNVILVDFRGFDTMGEITVLAVAAIGVFALMKFKKES